MLDRVYSDAEIDAAVQALAEPGRLEGAQDSVARIAPQLQGLLGQALDSGGWFGTAHEQQVTQAAGAEPVEERVRAVRTLIAEETRLGMLVGVAVGIELARELARHPLTTKEDD